MSAAAAAAAGGSLNTASAFAKPSLPATPLVLDAHLHVWPTPGEYSYVAGKEPPASLAESATTEALLERFATSGVYGALIVQPINLMFDHKYIQTAIATHPGRFVGCCLADPSVGGGGVEQLARLLKSRDGAGEVGEGGGGFRAVRFNPGLWPEGERMTNDVGRAMFRLAGARGAPVGFMCFHGLHLHVEDIRALCTEFPDTPVLMDHFGFCKGVEDDTNWPALLSLAQFPQVTVKASAQFRVLPSGGGRAWAWVAPAPHVDYDVPTLMQPP
jgi:predicted TIM-barrel fold metal-dependent hydrolase